MTLDVMDNNVNHTVSGFEDETDFQCSTFDQFDKTPKTQQRSTQTSGKHTKNNRTPTVQTVESMFIATTFFHVQYAGGDNALS